jgi:hypothetical protein
MINVLAPICNQAHDPTIPINHSHYTDQSLVTDNIEQSPDVKLHAHCLAQQIANVALVINHFFFSSQVHVSVI